MPPCRPPSPIDPKAKPTPVAQKAAVRQVVDFKDAPEFDCARLSATLLAFTALLLLILDVVLGHSHTLLACTAAAGLLLIAAFINFLRSLCLTDAEKKKANIAICHNVICIVNIMTLDSFLYEEETYNYFGHTENELKKERTVAAFLELFIAILISWTIWKEYRKPPAGGSFKKPKPSSMV